MHEDFVDQLGVQRLLTAAGVANTDRLVAGGCLGRRDRVLDPRTYRSSR